MDSTTSRGASPGGRRLAYGLAAGLGLGAAAVAGPILMPAELSLTVLSLGASLAAAGAGFAAWRRVGALREAADKVSGEIDVLSRRLVRLEARLAEVDRTGAAAGDEQRGAMAEITGEIALLGGLVRDLAVSVAAGERAVADLQAARAAPPRPEPRQEIRQEPRQETRQEVRAEARYEPPPVPREEPRPRAIVPEPVMAPPPRVAAAPAPPVADRRAAEVALALRADRIEVHLQPVVALPQRKVRFYEASAHLRGPDDETIAPAEAGPALEAAGLTPELDAKMVARAAAIARHLAARGSDGMVMIALAPASLRAPGFLRALGRVLESHPDVLGRLALAVSQRCWRTLDAEAAGVLGGLRARGVAFALDRAVDLRLDPLALADRGVRFAKIPADLLLRPSGGDAPDYAMPDLAAVLARAGIRLVAEGVEREGDVPDLIELDVPLAQGGVFAPPRALRPDVLGGPPPKPAETPAPAPEPPREKPGIAILPASAARTEERVPLRSLLRRAL